MRSLSLAFLSLLAACGPQTMVVPPEVKDPVVTKVEGGLEAGTAVTQAPIAMTSTPIALSSAAGELTVVGADTLFRRSSTSGTIDALPVGTTGEQMASGPVHFVARRGDASLWVVAGNGLFHLAEGRLLKSPLSADVAALTVTAIDTYGSGTAEELWLTTTTGVQHVKGGTMRAVEVQFPKLGALGVPVAAIGAGADQAVMVAKEQAFLVDLGKSTATWIAKDVGTLKAWARNDDGSVLLATTTGLYERLKSGEVRVRAGITADDVVTALGQVLVASGGKVARLEGGTFKTFGDLAAPRARGLQVDAAGDTFALDAAVLVKFPTGKPVSFAADVRPFLIPHCNTCHAAGSQGSPIIDFSDYATAKSNAAVAIKRLKAEGIAPMPPSNTEVLSAADYAVVLKWFAGGMQP